MKLYTPPIYKALRIAYDAHHGQTDKSGVPYIYHPAFLAAQMDSEDEIITALLHDVVEDTQVTFEDLESEGFPQSVLDALLLLTHNDGSEYMGYVRRIKQNPLATKVKLADLRHNSDPMRNANLSPEDAERYKKKYAKAILTLEYEEIFHYHDSAPIAAKWDGKWGFIDDAKSFIYKEIRGHYGSLVGIREDGTMDVFGRYYSH